MAGDPLGISDTSALLLHLPLFLFSFPPSKHKLSLISCSFFVKSVCRTSSFGLSFSAFSWQSLVTWKTAIHKSFFNVIFYICNVRSILVFDWHNRLRLQGQPQHPQGLHYAHSPTPASYRISSSLTFHVFTLKMNIFWRLSSNSQGLAFRALAFPAHH